MTDQELKDLVASLAVGSKKTDELIAKTAEEIRELKKSQAKTDEQMAKTDEQMAKTDEQMARTDEQMAKTDKKISKLSKGWENMDSYIKNQSKSVERYFVKSLEKQNLQIADISFDEIYPNFIKRIKGEEIELDALLVNGDYVGILEVKTTLHKNDVEKMYESSISQFRKMCKEHKDKKLMVIVAGKDILKDAKVLAKKYGFVSMSKKYKKVNVYDLEARFY